MKDGSVFGDETHDSCPHFYPTLCLVFKSLSITKYVKIGKLKEEHYTERIKNDIKIKTVKRSAAFNENIIY